VRELTKFKNIPIMIGTNTLRLLLFAVGLFLVFNGLSATISFSILILLVLLSIVAHELGHAFCARAFGYDTKRVVITPLGGYAQIDVEDFEGTEAEYYIAAAGPFVNFAIAGMLIPFAFFGVEHTRYLMMLNAIIAVFNLIPAYPLDGGRMLRCLLAKKYDVADATIISCKVSHVLTFFTVTIALYCANLIIILLALFTAAFIYTHCRKEEQRFEKRY
jgi:Zn-dependent protease